MKNAVMRGAGVPDLPKKIIFSIKGGTREWHNDKPPRKNFYTDKHG